jgi:diguanylate cyclase (GGDEF)-like protein
MRFLDSDTHDPLTGMATEAALLRYVAAVLDNCDRGSPQVGFLQIDIDGLADLHDEFGAATRDAVLLGVADCLREGIRGVDLLGRSADGFGICMPELNAAQGRAAAQRLRFRVLASPVATGRGPLNITCSIGFALSNDPETSAALLIGRAREARRAAQCEGGDRVIAAA